MNFVGSCLIYANELEFYSMHTLPNCRPEYALIAEYGAARFMKFTHENERNITKLCMVRYVTTDLVNFVQQNLPTFRCFCQASQGLQIRIQTKKYNCTWLQLAIHRSAEPEILQNVSFNNRKHKCQTNSHP